MGKSLVIVESPAKAKTINKYLGSNYIVKSSVGHIRDLPTSGSAARKKAEEALLAKKREKEAANAAESSQEKTEDGESAKGGKQTKNAKKTKKKVKKAKPTEAEKKIKDYQALIRRMAIDPENNWEARYEILPGKEKVLKDLQAHAVKCDDIYLATDLDREGEAIAWHLRESLGGDPKRYKRVTFSEITKSALTKAFEAPGELDLDRVNAQQARRFLDRVVGFMVSPLLWKKVARGLSAGRVQSVAVRLISDREREIRVFRPDEFWDIFADLDSPDTPKSGSKVAEANQTQRQPLRGKVSKFQGEAFKPITKEQTDVAVAALKTASYIIAKREDKPKSPKPSAPFITSTLQQAASVRLGFGVKKTMVVAQKLYEAGHITYMRTDSTNLSEESLVACREMIAMRYGKDYVLPESTVYASKKGAQEAHEAIRPSDVKKHPDDLEADLEKDAYRLYDLIWRRFMACQMPPAEFDTTTLVIKAGDYEIRVNGRVLKFAGYRAALPPVAKKGDDEVEIPALKVGDKLDMLELDPNQHFTKPPARFSEARLVQELEKRGIGRPSTYAAIISTIQDRGYVKVEKKRFFSQKIGEIVTDRLTENFDALMDYNFTATMEEQLDEIAEGKLNWHSVLDDFYKGFTETLAIANEEMRSNEPTLTEIECPTCQRPMNIRTASTGVFLSCTGYALPPKERCKGTLNLVAGEEAEAITDGNDNEGDAQEILDKRRCKVCDTAMENYLIDEERKLHVCGSNPDCPGYEVEVGKFKIKGYDGPIVECDKCGEDMQLKTGRFGKYFGCIKYPDCKNTRKLLRSGEAAPPRADPIPMPELACEKSDGFFILRDGAAGIFLASNLFPRSRETRKPLVEDLLRHRDELDPKFHFLADAPAADKDGVGYLIRFGRKTQEYFLASEIEGKATGWTAIWDGSKWVEELAKKKKPASKKKVSKKISAKK